MKVFTLVLCALLMTTAAQAHHSFAMFDADITTEYTGVVEEFQWTNPHSWLQVKVGETEWSFEMGSPGGLAREGWRPHTVNPGDTVTVTAHPLKDGNPGGQLVSVVLPDGTIMGE